MDRTSSIVSLDALSEPVGFCDPASGKKKAVLRRQAARSALVVVANDPMQRVFVLHAWAGRVPTPTLTDMIFKSVADWRLKVVGIDASAMQSLYADALLMEAKHRLQRLPLS